MKEPSYPGTGGLNCKHYNLAGQLRDTETPWVTFFIWREGKGLPLFLFSFFLLSPQAGGGILMTLYLGCNNAYECSILCYDCLQRGKLGGFLDSILLSSFLIK